MFVDEIRRALMAASRMELPAVSAALWRAVTAGEIGETEAAELDGLIRARAAIPVPSASPLRRVGSRPRSDASMERRRRWAASGRLPPQVACRFTLAEQAVLAVVAAETVKRGDCRLCHGHLAAIAGVARSTVRATLRRARDLGIVSIEIRRVTGWRNESSVVRIVSDAWTAWNRLKRRSAARGSDDISSVPTSTQSLRVKRGSDLKAKKRGFREGRRGDLGAHTKSPERESHSRAQRR